MSIIVTKVDYNSIEFKNNYIYMQSLVEELQAKTNVFLNIADFKKQQYINKHKNKLLARERIKYLLDPDPKFPFLEF